MHGEIVMKSRYPCRFTAVLFACAAALAACSPASTAQPATGAGAQSGQPPRTVGQSVMTENVVYALGQGRIAIIDPQGLRTVKELTDGLAGVSWGDPIVSTDERYLFANDQTNSQVVVIDTARQEIVKRLDVGPRPNHIYNPNHGKEIWTHSDEEGAFYVIDTDTLEVTARVVAALQGTGHGKLLYHPQLGSKAYATNTNDAAAFVIDLDKKAVTNVIPMCLTADGTGGTHGKAYSRESGQAYFQCSRGLNAMALVDPATDTVTRYLEGNGQIFTTPDERLAVIVDKGAGRLHVVDATRGSEIVASIPAEGGPDKISYYQDGAKLYGIVANTMTPDATVVDLTTMTVLARVPAGDINRPAGASSLHRSGDVAGRFYFTPASADGAVAIIDLESLTLHGMVPVDGADDVAFVGARQG
jgi:DNA-binding beta-propeller fold protein YncE